MVCGIYVCVHPSLTPTRLIVDTWETRDIGVMFDALRRRPLLTQAVVCFKSLSVVHHLMQQGAPEVCMCACVCVYVYVCVCVCGCPLLTQAVVCFKSLSVVHHLMQLGAPEVCVYVYICVCVGVCVNVCVSECVCVCK